MAKSPDGEYTLRLVTTLRERSKGKPPHVVVDGLVAKLPEAKDLLRLMITPREESDGKPRYDPAIVITAQDVEQKPVLFIREGVMDCFWGPKESGFAVIRCKAEHSLHFLALDLNRAKTLRELNEFFREAALTR